MPIILFTIILIAKEAADLKKMFKSFSNFLEKRELILSVEKSKIMTLKKGRGRKRKKWFWNGIEIEEVVTSNI